MASPSDTIAAIATSVGESGIGIVRISGRDALKIADKIFRPLDGKRPSEFATYTVHYGWIIGGSGAVVDEVILTVMRAPKSYTKEDVVEVNCHGGIVALRAVLDLVLENGCRLAQPGEFTKRAFLNGRIDLAQAEAVLDVIRAKTDYALKIGAEQLGGALSCQISGLRKRLLDILSVLEANIDFPEEGLDSINLSQLGEKLNKINSELKYILDASRRGRVFREGVHVVICGKPNVGKSSLLNALLKQERSIVTPVAGTTRDTVEEIIDIKGIPIRIVDTAGIIKPRGIVEKKAIERSNSSIDLSDLVILLFDGSRALDKQDRALIAKLRKKQVLAVINKMDLKQKIEKEKLKKRFKHIVSISAKRYKGINLLEDAIADSVWAGKACAGKEAAMMANIRHIQAIKNAQKLIEQATGSIGRGLSIEFVSQDVKDAIGFLDDMLGKRFSEDLLDRIFSEFCIGK